MPFLAGTVQSGVLTQVSTFITWIFSPITTPQNRAEHSFSLRALVLGLPGQLVFMTSSDLVKPGRIQVFPSDPYFDPCFPLRRFPQIPNPTRSVL